MSVLNLFHRQRLLLGLLGVAIAGLGPRTVAHGVEGVSAEMALAAQRFLQALSPEQRAQATFPLESAERLNWHYIPRDRQGLSVKDLSPEQVPLAHALLASALSHRGYLQVSTIMSLEAILKDLEEGRGPVRDPARYFFSVFGEPDAAKAWGWRVEGHHLSLNFVVAGGHGITATPSFFGSNPGRVLSGPREGLRALADEEDLGRQLVQSLTPDQRKIAITRETAPRDVILDPSREATPLDPAGLPASQLQAGQRETLRALIRCYLFRYRTELAEEAWSRLETAGFDRVHFAWAGPTNPGAGHYYCVQGPTFILEYDNTQNDANHVHTVWRDFQNDFGADLLREHHEHGDHTH